MRDIPILFYIFSLFTAVASLSISIFINIMKRNILLRCYIGLICSFFFIQITIFINQLLTRFENKDSFLANISKWSDILGTSCSSLFGLLLIHYLFEKRIDRFRKFSIVGIFSFQFVGQILDQWVIHSNLIYWLGKASLVMVISYEILVLFIENRKHQNKTMQKILKMIAIITLIYFPLFLFETARPYIPVLKQMDLLKIISSPAYFLALNLYSIVISLKYFNQPVKAEENKLKDSFIKEYGITKKEVEIIHLIMTGMTYKKISEDLVISAKTVDNHVQNIYKKLGVSNKVQLINRINGDIEHPFH